MRAVIIDNEIPVIRGLEKLLKLYCPQVQVVGEAQGVSSGKKLIDTVLPDLVFLDIEMEDGLGIDLLTSLPSRTFQVIFITAFNQYAVQAFRLSAIDYLLKPVDPEDLVEAVQKAQEAQGHTQLSTKIETLLTNWAASSAQKKKIVLKDAENIHFVAVEQIVYCKAEGSYTRFFLKDQPALLVSRHLKLYEEILQPYPFFRVHHTFLVNLHYILRFEKSEGGMLVLENGERLPVSNRKRDQLLKLLSTY